MPKKTEKKPKKQANSKVKSKGVFGQGAKVGIYTRVSTHDQKTLPLQIRSLKRYAKQRDWSVSLVIKDVGSGATERTERDKLLVAARRRDIDIILVWKLDRWGRSVTDLLATLQELSEIGVGFVSLTEAFDLTTASGRAMAGLLAVFAEFERDLLRERVKAGLAEAKKKGVVLGRPPTASTKSDEVRKLAAKKLSKSEIARRLNIGRTSVRRILNDAS
jgi:DNA invertase Pin-like site-specific DNA recombinase